MAVTARGSDNLSGDEVSEEHLAGMVALGREQGIELIQLWRLGRPAVDQVGGIFRADRAAAAQVLGKLLDSDVAYAVEAFPYGIPAIDAVQITFKSLPGQVQA
jgi:hypothetical protein